jgi:hypothetical protein
VSDQKDRQTDTQFRKFVDAARRLRQARMNEVFDDAFPKVIRLKGSAERSRRISRVEPRPTASSASQDDTDN